MLRADGGRGRRAPTFLFAVLLLIDLGLLGGAAFLVIDTRGDIARADRADGTVVALIGEQGSDGGTVYYPRVRYVTRSGNPMEFTGSVGSSPPAFDVGEIVGVLYDPAAPEAARIDSFFQLWLAPLILGGIGLMLAAVGGGAALAVLRARGRLEEPGVQTPMADAERPPVTRAVERTARD